MSIEELEQAAGKRRAELASRPASGVRGMAPRARATLADSGEEYLAEWEAGTGTALAALVAAASLDGQPVTVGGREIALVTA